MGFEISKKIPKSCWGEIGQKRIVAKVKIEHSTWSACSCERNAPMIWEEEGRRKLDGNGCITPSFQCLRVRSGTLLADGTVWEGKGI